MYGSDYYAGLADEIANKTAPTQLEIEKAKIFATLAMAASIQELRNGRGNLIGT